MNDTSRKKVALLEKSGLSREHIMNILVDAGYAVTPFASFSELPKSSFSWKEFDAVILDPDAGGDAANDLIHNLVSKCDFPPKLHLIIYTFNDDLARCITPTTGLVNCVFLSKSIHPDKLIKFLSPKVDTQDPDSAPTPVTA